MNNNASNNKSNEILYDQLLKLGVDSDELQGYRLCEDDGEDVTEQLIDFIKLMQWNFVKDKVLLYFTDDEINKYNILPNHEYDTMRNILDIITKVEKRATWEYYETNNEGADTIYSDDGNYASQDISNFFKILKIMEFVKGKKIPYINK